MVKSKRLSTDTERKFRWVQSKNPMTAAWADVAASAITKNTSAGYSTWGWGGLYKYTSNNTSTYLCSNNGTNGNWWGAVGSYSVYQGGIPGWDVGGITTTGYLDVYVRVDNIAITPYDVAGIGKLGYVKSKSFIEN